MKRFNNRQQGMEEPAIYVLHENDEWVDPLKAALEEKGMPHQFWFVNEGILNLQDVPPHGVFYNRLSASAHTRDHRYAIELAEPVITWLEKHNRRVVNGRNALNLEVRKAEQYLHLNRHNIRTPDTIVVNNNKDLSEAARQLNHFPFIVKPNRGGKGAGIELFQSIEELEEKLANGQVNFHSLDGITLVQQYVKPGDGNIVRLEFIGGQFYYAVQVDATGGFELCPADNCGPDDQFCPAGDNNTGFKILKDYYDPEITAYERLLKEQDIEVGAIEYVEDDNRNRYVFDININTNYNSKAESFAGDGYAGMKKIASYLQNELERFFKVERKGVAG